PIAVPRVEQARVLFPPGGRVDAGRRLRLRARTIWKARPLEFVRIECRIERSLYPFWGQPYPKRVHRQTISVHPRRNRTLLSIVSLARALNVSPSKLIERP